MWCFNSHDFLYLLYLNVLKLKIDDFSYIEPLLTWTE